MSKLRILDVGCHDGFVGAWVRKHLEAAGVEVELHGIEPHPGFAQAARDRGYEQVHVGLAEGVVGEYPSRHFDAAVLYEIWEHVPDPDALCEAVERVVKKDGLVYLSTPEGAFGEGSNPHHLRAVRGVDFFDFAARRGTIQSFFPGQDGVNALAYRPARRQKPKREVAIVLPSGWERWHPADMESRGLGGSETAACRLADHLTVMGAHVTLYADLEVGGWRSVTLRHVDTFDPMDERDVLIVQRSALPFMAHHAAGRAMLWVHDTTFGPLPDVAAERLDDVLCLSDWHRAHLAAEYPALDGKLRRIRNGIEPVIYEQAREKARPRQRRVVYSSSPDRGLDVLVDVWPLVRERVPDAELACCYADVYDRVAEVDETVGAHRAQLREKIGRTEGVTALGSLPQPGLALLMAESMVWAHPSMTPHGPFYETSCIGAMEAQAAGCLVVASGWGALPETVQVGRLVDAGDDWQERFVEQLADALLDTEGQEWAQDAGPEWARGLGWGPVAQAVLDGSRGQWRDVGPDARPALAAAVDG